MGSLNFTDIVIRLWSKASICLVTEPHGRTEQQLFMYWHAKPHISPTYMYVHEDVYWMFW
eukprot:c8226_g1_i1 orf=14-193(+)